jgi:hypothetical protein
MSYQTALERKNRFFYLLFSSSALILSPTHLLLPFRLYVGLPNACLTKPEAFSGTVHYKPVWGGYSGGAGDSVDGAVGIDPQVAVMPELRAAPQRLLLPCVCSYNTKHLTQTRTQAPAPSIYDEIDSPRVILASSLSVRQAG